MGNLQVRFLEGWAPAMAPGHSTLGSYFRIVGNLTLGLLQSCSSNGYYPRFERFGVTVSSSPIQYSYPHIAMNPKPKRACLVSKNRPLGTEE